MLNREFTTSKLLNRSEMLPSKKRTAFALVERLVAMFIVVHGKSVALLFADELQIIRSICW